MPTLLIVEDEEILGKNIRRALEKLGHAVSLAPTCGDAERLFSELNPDLTLMDLRLPDGSGLVDRLTVMIRIEGEPLESVLERIVLHGGLLALAPVNIGGAGRFARFFDPAGNSFGLWEARGGGAGESVG